MARSNPCGDVLVVHDSAAMASDYRERPIVQAKQVSPFFRYGLLRFRAAR